MIDKARGKWNIKVAKLETMANSLNSITVIIRISNLFHTEK